MKCFKCGLNIFEDEATFCPKCGARLDSNISCPSCGQLLDGTYKYCVFCGANIDENSNCTPSIYDTTLAKKSGEIDLNENGNLWNTIFSWLGVGMGIVLVSLAFAFVFMIGFQFNYWGHKQAITEAGFDFNNQNIKLFYYFSDAYKDIAKIKEMALFESELPIIGAYIHSILGTIISIATIGCVIVFAILAIIGFIKFFIIKAENNCGKWAVRAAISYIAGSVSLFVLNICKADIALTVPISTTVGKPLQAKMMITFDKITIVGIILCTVFLLIYAGINYLKKGKGWKNKKTIINCIFNALVTTFAIVACLFGMNAIVGTKMITTSGWTQSLEFTLAQLPFSSFLVSSFELTDPLFYKENLTQINVSYVFAVVQEVMALGMVVGALSTMATCILETEGKTKITLLLSIMTAFFAGGQLVAGIVSHTVMHNLYVDLMGVDTVETTLILRNSIITVVFAGLQLLMAIVYLSVKKLRKNS